MAILLPLILISCKDKVTGIEGFCPEVLSINPANLATGVGLNTVITVTFNAKMNPATINPDAFALTGPAAKSVLKELNTSTASKESETANINGVISFDDDTNTMTFTPNDSLVSGEQYTFKVNKTVEDPLGNTMLEDFVSTFTAAESSETAAPTVVSTNPQDADEDVALDHIVTATFNEAMALSSLDQTTFTLFDGTNQVDGSVSYNGLTASFEADDSLSAGTTYTATITTGAENEVGTAIEQDFEWDFTTQFSLIITAIDGSVDTDPLQGSYNNGDNVELTAVPDNGYSFDSWSGDATGNSNPLIVIMDENKEITAIFTENPPLGPGNVNLGTAGDFVILTKTGISTTGTTLVTGHIGVTPATSTAITGFSPTMDASGEFATSDYVVGNIYAADYAPPTPDYVSTAMSDQEEAFTNAMGMTTDVINELGAGDISGMTLVPGLYKWGTGLLITNEGVTLEGGPNDTWVFQIADDFTVSNDAQITLAGGANVDNIYWITSTQALIGSNVDFKGNLLAQTLISLTNGSNVDGRLLSQSEVTLDASTVTIPE